MWCVVCGGILVYNDVLVTIMIYGAVVHHPSEAGARLGRCLVDALSQGLESKEITDVQPSTSTSTSTLHILQSITH